MNKQPGGDILGVLPFGGPIPEISRLLPRKNGPPSRLKGFLHAEKPTVPGATDTLNGTPHSAWEPGSSARTLPYRL
jgi:hypothetical protein